jgi:hypothetical protein
MYSQFSALSASLSSSDNLQKVKELIKVVMRDQLLEDHKDGNPMDCQHRSGVSDINETKRGDTCSICVSPTCLAVDLRSIYAQRSWN